MKIALVQMCSSNKLEENLVKLDAWLLEAQQLGVKLVVLPENFALMANHKKEKIEAQELFGEGKVQAWLSQKSKDYQLWIVAGSFPIRSVEANRPYARCLVYNPQGELASYYDKIHLFDVEVADGESYLESSDTYPGLQPKLLSIGDFKIGLSICYDVRFPELYRYYQSQDANLILVPSAFTQNTGKLHWEFLLRTRAIENLSYVAAANQTGTHKNGRQTYGHSMVVDPWGRKVAALQAEQGLLVVDLDPELVTKVRNKFPAHKHRKLDT